MDDKFPMSPDGMLYGLGGILAAIGGGIGVVYRVFIGKPLRHITHALEANAEALRKHEREELERMERHEREQEAALKQIRDDGAARDKSVAVLEEGLRNLRVEVRSVNDGMIRVETKIDRYFLNGRRND